VRTYRREQRGEVVVEVGGRRRDRQRAESLARTRFRSQVSSVFSWSGACGTASRSRIAVSTASQRLPRRLRQYMMHFFLTVPINQLSGLRILSHL